MCIRDRSAIDCGGETKREANSSGKPVDFAGVPLPWSGLPRHAECHGCQTKMPQRTCPTALYQYRSLAEQRISKPAHTPSFRRSAYKYRQVSCVQPTYVEHRRKLQQVGGRASSDRVRSTFLAESLGTGGTSQLSNREPHLCFAI